MWTALFAYYFSLTYRCVICIIFQYLRVRVGTKETIYFGSPASDPHLPRCRDAEMLPLSAEVFPKKQNKIHINFPSYPERGYLWFLGCVRVLFIWLFLIHFYWLATLCHCWILLRRDFVPDVSDLSGHKQILRVPRPLVSYVSLTILFVWIKLNNCSTRRIRGRGVTLQFTSVNALIIFAW